MPAAAAATPSPSEPNPTYPTPVATSASLLGRFRWPRLGIRRRLGEPEFRPEVVVAELTSSHTLTRRRRRLASSVTLEGTARALLSLGALVLWAAVPLPAQGVTGAAIEGRVLARDSTPVEQAIVQVTNTSNGERWRTTTSARGRYFIEYLSVGGTYWIEVRAV